MLTTIDSVKGMNTSSTGDGLALGVSEQLDLANDVFIDVDKQSHVAFSVDVADNVVKLQKPSDVSVAGKIIVLSNVGENDAVLGDVNVSGVSDGGDVGVAINWPSGASQMFVWTGSKWSCMSTTLS